MCVCVCGRGSEGVKKRESCSFSKEPCGFHDIQTGSGQLEENVFYHYFEMHVLIDTYVYIQKNTHIFSKV